MKIDLKIDKEDFKKKLDIKDGYTPIKGVDYFDGKDGLDAVAINGLDGKDADEEMIIEEVTKKVTQAIVIPDDSGEVVVKKINELEATPEYQIDFSHIKNAPEFSGSKGSGLRNIFHDTSLTGTGTVADPLKVVNGGTTLDLETNGTPNGDQALLNLVNGANVTITDDGLGNVTIAANDTDTGITELTGDITAGPGSGSQVATLATVNSNVGTFNNITINAKGLATAGSNVAYLTGNQTITLSGEASGSGTTGIAVTLANSAVIGKVLTGYVSGAGTVASTDTILQAFQKLNGNIGALVTGVSSVNSATGAVTLTVSNTGTSGTLQWSGTALQIPQADTDTTGLLSDTDWDTFNNKQPAGTYVTSVTGTSNRITSTGGTTPVIDISATFEALLGKVANPLSQFAATTSSQLAGVISDETGSGALVFGTAPTVTLASASTAVTQAPADNSTKIATTAYVQAAIFATQTISAVKYATTAALTATYANGASGVGATLTEIALGALSVDGATPSVNDRILVKNQASTFQNGIYTVTVVGSGAASYVLTRSTDYNVSADINLGDTVFVSAGSTLASTTWTQNGTENPVMGTDAITFAQTAGPGSYTAGNGLTLTGTSFSINTAITADLSTAQALTNKNLNSGTNTFPTFNQNTTGSAATLTTTRTIWGQNFNGSANVTGSLTAVTDITGGASNMVITSGTGASRTLTLRTTTAGSTATTALLLGADQTSSFAAKLFPTTDDGAALGDTTHNFSDLFLATGAVVNFANSNVVMTHSSGILTIGTGTLKITTPTNNSTSVLTTDATQTITNKSIVASQITTGTFGTGAYTMDTSLTVPLINGSTAANGDITIRGTSSGTKTSSYVLLQDTGGNVGIGTTSPGSALDIQGGGIFRLGGSTSPSYPASGEGFEMAYDTDANHLGAAGSGVSVFQSYARTGSAWRDVWFRGNNITFSANATNVMTLLASNSSVGIGTTAPTTKLQIELNSTDYTNTAGANSHILLSNANVSGQTSLSFTFNGTMAAKLRADFSNVLNYESYSTSGTSHLWWTGGPYLVGNYRMALTSAGALIIAANNASPSAQLHVIATTEQQRLGYDTSNYFSTTVGSTGGVTFNAVGSGSLFTFSDPVVMRRKMRVYSTTSTATLTPEIDTYDLFCLTAQAAALNIANPSTSTPNDGDQIKIRILDNGTARAITYGTAYVAKAGITLPTITRINKNFELLFEYNSNLAKWNLLAFVEET